MKIHFNKENILKYAEIGLAAIVLIEGSRLVANKISDKKAKNVKPSIQNEEMVEGTNLETVEYNGTTYFVPEGYTLEAGDNTVRVVRRSVNKVKPVIETIDGVVTYSLPEGYRLEGNVGVREVTEYTQPSKTLTKTK